MTVTEAEDERQRLEAEIGRLEAERMQVGYSTGMPDAASIAARNAYLAELDERIAEIRKKLPPPRSTLHSRPPLPPGWSRDWDDESGHHVDYDPYEAVETPSGTLVAPDPPVARRK